MSVTNPMLAVYNSGSRDMLGRLFGVPPIYRAGLTKGEFLLSTCWAAGLSPRAVALDSTGTPAYLRFVPSPLAIYSSTPPTLQVIENSAVPLAPQPLSQGYPYEEVQVKSLLDQLASADKYGITVAAPASLLRQWAFVNFPAQMAFTELLDQLTLALDAVWDWSGDRAIMAPRTARHCREVLEPSVAGVVAPNH